VQILDLLPQLIGPRRHKVRRAGKAAPIWGEVVLTPPLHQKLVQHRQLILTSVKSGSEIRTFQNPREIILHWLSSIANTSLLKFQIKVAWVIASAFDLGNSTQSQKVAIGYHSPYQIEITVSDIPSFIFASRSSVSKKSPLYFDAENPTKCYSLEEAEVMVKRIAKGLQNIGLQKGERVLLVSGNQLHFPVLFLGCDCC
jgi:hypothetical protein